MNEITGIVVRLAEKKDDLRINGLTDIHPMHEALTALLRQYLPDAAIVQRYAKDENSTRAVIVCDSLMGFVPAHERDYLKDKLSSGIPLEKIIEQAALYIAEGKRIHEGNILVSAISAQRLYPVLKDRLAGFPKEATYISQTSLAPLVRKCDIRRKLRYSLLAALGAGCAYIYYARNEFSCFLVEASQSFSTILQNK